jgi:geranylgeranyl pyrophosphate synthase
VLLILSENEIEEHEIEEQALQRSAYYNNKAIISLQMVKGKKDTMEALITLINDLIKREN